MILLDYPSSLFGRSLTGHLFFCNCSSFIGDFSPEDDRLAMPGMEMYFSNEDFMMKYVITDMETGETVFETGLIPSGECVKWAPGHSLGEGEHHLNFHIAPYYPSGDQYLPLTSANNEVTLTIGEM